MSRDDHAHLYRAVPVLVWPWLWWQLFRLRLWVAATGRDVLCGVDRWGNLHVHLVGDDPGCWAPSAHPHLHQYYLTADLPDETRPQWRARLAAVFCEGRGVQAWVIFPRRAGEACGAETYETPARIRDPVERKTALSLSEADTERVVSGIALSPSGTRCEAGSATGLRAAHEPGSGLCPPSAGVGGNLGFPNPAALHG